MRRPLLLSALMLLSATTLNACASQSVGRVVQAPEQPKPLIPAALRSVPPSATMDFSAELKTLLDELNALLMQATPTPH